MDIEILLVEDEPIHHEHYHRLCHLAQVKLHIANNGQEALDFLSTQPKISLIVLDFSMPVMDGLRFLQHRAKSTEMLQIPVMMSTSYLEEDPMFTEAKANGWIHQFLPKGCPPELFVLALESVVKRDPL